MNTVTSTNVCNSDLYRFKGELHIAFRKFHFALWLFRPIDQSLQKYIFLRKGVSQGRQWWCWFLTKTDNFEKIKNKQTNKNKTKQKKRNTLFVCLFFLSFLSCSSNMSHKKFLKNVKITSTLSFHLDHPFKLLSFLIFCEFLLIFLSFVPNKAKISIYNFFFLQILWNWKQMENKVISCNNKYYFWPFSDAVIAVVVLM